VKAGGFNPAGCHLTLWIRMTSAVASKSRAANERTPQRLRRPSLHYGPNGCGSARPPQGRLRRRASIILIACSRRQEPSHV